MTLDVAASCGYAVHAGGRVAWGSKDFSGKPLAYLPAFQAWLRSEIVVRRIDTLAVEGFVVAPGLPPNERGMMMRGVAFAVAGERNLTLIDVPPNQWRKHFIGRGTAPADVGRGMDKRRKTAERRKWLKQRVREACEAKGWSPTNDDQADALGLLDYTRCLLDRGYGARSGPLFEQAEGAVL